MWNRSLADTDAFDVCLAKIRKEMNETRLWQVSKNAKENLLGVAIRCGQDHPDEYGKVGGQEVKRGVTTTRLS